MAGCERSFALSAIVILLAPDDGLAVYSSTGRSRDCICRHLLRGAEPEFPTPVLGDDPELDPL
jgi:hypothetical protein